MTDSLLDAVQARLADSRQKREGNVSMGREQVEQAPYALELADLTLIAERHFGKGFEGGYRDGYSTGHLHGLNAGDTRRRREDREIVEAIFQTLNERLGRWTERLADEPEGANDRRTKATLREEALQLIDEMRAAFSTTLVSFAQGAFDEGS